MSERGETVIQGIPASRGLAIGSIALRQAGPSLRRVAGTPAEERAALAAAMAKAGAQLAALAARAEPMAAAILEFQTALLEDDDLFGPVLERVAAGEAADRAWAGVLEREIAEYAAGDDETFAARAGDLADLRDRVLDALAPGAPARRGNGAEHAILVAEDLTPSRFLETDWTRYSGAALKAGSPAGHVALLARARGTPLVVGLGEAFRASRRRRASRARWRGRAADRQSGRRHAERDPGAAAGGGRAKRDRGSSSSTGRRRPPTASACSCSSMSTIRRCSPRSIRATATASA